jgi:hypothetical protein
MPVVLLRLLVCVLPLLSDTISPFGQGLDSESPQPSLLHQLGRAAFMLLVSVSWAVGLFLASFLLLPPAQHLAVQAASLVPLLLNNHSVCQHFLAQHPSNAAVIDTLDAGLRALVVSVAPVAHGELGAARPRASRTASCMAGAAALQVSLGLVLPTLLAWQLQSSTSAAGGMGGEPGTPPAGAVAAVQERPCRGARLAAAVARSAQGWAAKLLFTGSSMLLTFCLCVEMLDSAHPARLVSS